MFDDKTLAAIAAALPDDLTQLAAVRGIGPAKLEQYGDDRARAHGGVAARRRRRLTVEAGRDHAAAATMPHVSETTIEAASGRRARWAALHDVMAWRWFPHAVLFGLGFLIRLVWVVAVDRDGFAFNDSIMYHTTAMSISDGNGYVPLTGGPTARWPPGYSTVLGGLYWLFGQEPLAGELFNAVVGALTIVLLMLVVERTIDRGTAVVARRHAGSPSRSDPVDRRARCRDALHGVVRGDAARRGQLPPDLGVVHRHRRGRRARSPRAR